MQDKKNQNEINIELPEELAEGVYSNLAIITHSHSEFVLDFVRMVPNVPKAKSMAPWLYGYYILPVDAVAVLSMLFLFEAL